MGFAKGMWQFIRQTAIKYRLHLGPLVEQPQPDPADDRHNYEKETKAAALYIQDLYSTDAQASEFLVIACYNWGESQVLPLIRSMPANPRERNFWKLLSKHRNKIPQQTYDCVFNIASAAVIEENPRLFGFKTEEIFFFKHHSLRLRKCRNPGGEFLTARAFAEA
jgi:membrane-bound lytic murein transglycosylase D